MTEDTLTLHDDETAERAAARRAAAPTAPATDEAGPDLRPRRDRRGLAEDDEDDDFELDLTAERR